MNTAQELEKMTDEGKFERLSISVLRKANPDYANIGHTGVNAAGKTRKCPLDGLGQIPDSQAARAPVQWPEACAPVGYVDLYLQAAYEPKRSAHYFIELKYAKARASKRTLDKKEQEGVEAMRKYLQTDSAKGINSLQAYVLAFRKDKCVRKIRCSGH